MSNRALHRVECILLVLRTNYEGGLCGDCNFIDFRQLSFGAGNNFSRLICATGNLKKVRKIDEYESNRSRYG
jgi:hypothetical protein